MALPPLAIAQYPPPCAPRCWSELPFDLMQLIFERLSFTDFERAKLVCSSWQTGSRQSKPNNKIPWMILFPEEKNYVLLFNPEDREKKLYKSQHLGNNFANSFCLATCKSWLLMIPLYENGKHPVYILNLLTRERINLPPTSNGRPFYAILWIDDKTKDYLVIGETLEYCKKGYNSWKQISEGIQGKQEHMVFKDHKLYCLNNDELRIFDFSGEFPLQVSRVRVGKGREKPEIYSRMRFPVPAHVQEFRRRNNVVATVQGDVLIIKSESPFMSKTWNFKIFKMDSSNGLEEIDSLGDEAILLDLGITVLAKDHEGVTSNSIYFTGGDDTILFVFNLDTKKLEELTPFVSSSVTLLSVRWFLPSFKNA